MPREAGANRASACIFDRVGEAFVHYNENLRTKDDLSNASARGVSGEA